MSVVDLDKLKSDIDKLATDRDSSFFHGLVAQLAELLGFHKKEEWYEADRVIGPPLQFISKDDLGDANKLLFFTNYAYRNKFIKKETFLKENNFLVSTTNHPSFEALDSDFYVARSVMSNSTLGLEQRIIRFEEVRERFPSRAGRDSLALTFEADYLVKKGNLYFLHPRFLYELVKKKYFN